MGIKNTIKKISFLDNLYLRYRNKQSKKAQMRYGDEYLIKQQWKKVFGYNINLDSPNTMNEKIQWLKMHDRKDIYTIWADKYGCREYIEKVFGSDFLVPLLFKTDKVSEINKTNINSFPCVVKANHTSGDYCFIKDKNDINWRQLRRKCKTWLKCDYYANSQEWQYKNIKRYIIVEKMLLDRNGKIPNDYKLHFIEGKLAFVYCSIDREGDNYRQIYDSDWNLLPFSWDANDSEKRNHSKIDKPKNLEKMVEIGLHFASKMHYVRVDFYEVDGKVYCGEITLHHGGGFDKFNPSEYDLLYGKMLNVPF